jgi:predicted MFS family arabinose efflux permease
MGVMLFIMPATSAFLLVVGLYAIYRFLQAAFMPVMNSMIASQANRENLSLCFSFNFVVVNLFGSVATTGVSMLIESNSTSIIFPLSIIGFIPCLALVYILWNRYNRD